MYLEWNRTRHSRVLLVCLIFCLAACAYAATPMSPEERAVRTAYANASYASELGAVNAAVIASRIRGITNARDLQDAAQNSAVQFEIKDFQVHTLTEFGRKEGADLVLVTNYPKFTPLLLAVSQQAAAEGRARLLQETDVIALWGMPPSGPDAPPLGTYTLADAWKDNQDLWVTTIATYTVTASLDGKRQTYPAVALFDSSINPQHLIVDPATPGIDTFLDGRAYTLYPIFLLASVAYDSPAGRAYLEESASVRGAACRLDTRLPCGPLLSDIAKRNASRTDSRSIELDGVKVTNKADRVSVIEAEPPSGSVSCPQYNFTQPPVPGNTFDTNQHLSGSHSLQATFGGACTYTAIPNTNVCNALASAEVSITYPYGESGAIKVGGFHVGKTASSAMSAYNGVAQAAEGVSILNCSTPNCSVGISANPVGVGFTYAPNAVWDGNLPYSNTCPAESSPPTPPPPPPVCQPNSPQPAPTNGDYYYWSTSTCSWVAASCYPDHPNWCAGGSPIIIDTDGSGFHLTSGANGVAFDLFATGDPIALAWTEASSTNGWLALDRNQNGRIDNGKELFGNITDQPKLLVWIDQNHDGISQSEELFPLSKIGIGKIDLRYGLSKHSDEYGNQFRYRGLLGPRDLFDQVDRTIYDVFLVFKTSAPVEK